MNCGIKLIILALDIYFWCQFSVEYIGVVALPVTYLMAHSSTLRYYNSGLFVEEIMPSRRYANIHVPGHYLDPGFFSTYFSVAVSGGCVSLSNITGRRLSGFFVRNFQDDIDIFVLNATYWLWANFAICRVWLWFRVGHFTYCMIDRLSRPNDLTHLRLQDAYMRQWS